MKIPRSYFSGSFEQLELHVFVDSSQEVFSAAILRALVNSSDHGKRTELAFVIGKARVAPMKVLTVSKLELQAALLASRLREEICEALTIQIQRTFMWTDSTTVLQWLNSLEKQRIFVANCVSEILEGTTVDQWHHVATQNNPADAGTRGCPRRRCRTALGYVVLIFLVHLTFRFARAPKWCQTSSWNVKQLIPTLWTTVQPYSPTL